MRTVCLTSLLAAIGTLLMAISGVSSSPVGEPVGQDNGPSSSGQYQQVNSDGSQSQSTEFHQTGGTTNFLQTGSN